MSTDTKQSLIHKKEEGCCFHSEVHSIVYTWTIDQISLFLESAKSNEKVIYLDSPKFSTDSKIRDSWSLQLEIKKDNESECKSWVSIYLKSYNFNRKIRTKCLLFLLNEKKEKILKDFIVYKQSMDYYYINYLFDGSTAYKYGYPEFVKIDELLRRKHEFSKTDSLTFGVDLTVYDDYVPVNGPNNLLEGYEQKISDDFKDLFKTKKKCDITIKVGDKEFEAHKVILISRSSVFEAMFLQDMNENKEHEVTIPDIDPEVFKKVLDYMYTDKVEDLISFAENLLEAADKYQLFGLKNLCECSLSKTLSPGNAVKILVLADRHYAKRLEEVAIDFIANNWIKFKNTEEFKQLEKFHIHLAYAVVKKYADGLEKK